MGKMLKRLVGKRFMITDLIEELKILFIGNNIKIEDIKSDVNNIDDYLLIETNNLNITLYYILTNEGKYYITEVYSEKNNKSNDKDIIRQIKDFCETSHSYLSQRTEYARGYYQGVSQIKQSILDIINEVASE